MRKLLFILILIGGSISAMAQSGGILWTQYYITGSLSVGNAKQYSPSSAWLSVGPDDSSHRGLRMPVGYKDSIASPVKGLEIFNMPDSAVWVYSGTTWIKQAQASDIAGFVPTSRILTINGVAQNLSADRTWAESDPTFTASAARDIGASDVANWNDAYDSTIRTLNFDNGLLYLQTVSGTQQSVSLDGRYAMASDTAFILPEWFGAIGDSMTNDRVALQAAINYAAAGGRTVLLRKFYYVDSSITIPAGVRIQGNGYKSAINIKTNSRPIFVLLGSNTTIDNVYFFGKRTADTGQHAIYINGSIGGVKENITLINCGFSNMGGCGTYVVNNNVSGSAKLVATREGVAHINNWAFNCFRGYKTALRGEYNTYSSCLAYGCNIGWLNGGGNNNWVNGYIVRGDTGVFIQGGVLLNDAHGSMVGARVNHNNSTGNTGFAVYTDSVTKGFIFSACEFYGSGDLNVKKSVGVQFSNCLFGTLDINFEGGNNNVMLNNQFWDSIDIDTAFNADPGNPFWFNNKWVNITKPTWMKDRIMNTVQIDGNLYVRDVSSATGDFVTRNSTTGLVGLRTSAQALSDLGALSTAVAASTYVSQTTTTGAGTDSLVAVVAGALKKITTADYLRARANHTGEQAISTITGLQPAIDAKQATLGGSGIVKSAAGVISYVADNSTAWNAAFPSSGGALSGGITGTTAAFSGALSGLNLTATGGNVTMSGDIIQSASANGSIKIGGSTITRYLNIVTSSAGAALYGIGSGSNTLKLGAGVSDDVFIDASHNVNINTTTSVPSALLNLSATNRGFLPPRMTAAQGSAISSPAEGLMIYVTDTNGTFTSKGWWGWDGAAWKKFDN